MLKNNFNLAEKIRFVAEVIYEPALFSSRAQTVANEVGAAAIPLLVAEFHTEHTPPDSVLESKFPRLGQWAAARQFAIFEVFYCLGDASLPILRKVAHGEYDWTQGNAIEVLCRFAADGIESIQIVDELKQLIPDLRYEALYYAIAPLMERGKNNPNLQVILQQLQEVPIFKEVCDEIAS